MRYHFDSLKVAELRRQIAHTQREKDKLDRRLQSLSRSLQYAETKRRPGSLQIKSQALKRT